ncbi:MAG: hypothetical protein H6622_06880 [Halobacteriovoraceae bacterium]|nr:hypothetical protein [Halobacteriovoraceae bacterium]
MKIISFVFLTFCTFAEVKALPLNGENSSLYYSEIDVSIDEYDKMVYVVGLTKKNALKKAMSSDLTYAQEVVKRKIIDSLTMEENNPISRKRKFVKVHVLKVLNHTLLRVKSLDKNFNLSFFSLNARVAVISNFKIKPESEFNNYEIKEVALKFSNFSETLKTLDIEKKELFLNPDKKNPHFFLNLQPSKKIDLMYFLRRYINSIFRPDLKIELILISEKSIRVIPIQFEELFQSLGIQRPSLPKKVIHNCLNLFTHNN